MAKKKFILQKHPPFKWLLPVLVVIVLLLIFNAYYHKNASINKTSSEQTSVTPTISTNNWQTYKDQAHGYTIKYPENWTYQKVTNEEGTSIRFYENGVTPRQTYMMARGNEQLILSTIANKTLKELEASTKIPQTTIAEKPAIRLSTGAYVELSPYLILSIHAPTYPQPAMGEILESLNLP